MGTSTAVIPSPPPGFNFVDDNGAPIPPPPPGFSVVDQTNSQPTMGEQMKASVNQKALAQMDQTNPNAGAGGFLSNAFQNLPVHPIDQLKSWINRPSEINSAMSALPLLDKQISGQVLNANERDQVNAAMGANLGAPDDTAQFGQGPAANAASLALDNNWSGAAGAATGGYIVPAAAGYGLSEVPWAKTPQALKTGAKVTAGAVGGAMEKSGLSSVGAGGGAIAAHAMGLDPRVGAVVGGLPGTILGAWRGAQATLKAMEPQAAAVRTAPIPPIRPGRDFSPPPEPPPQTAPIPPVQYQPKPQAAPTPTAPIPPIRPGRDFSTPTPAAPNWQDNWVQPKPVFQAGPKAAAGEPSPTNQTLNRMRQNTTSPEAAPTQPPSTAPIQPVESTQPVQPVQADDLPLRSPGGLRSDKAVADKVVVLKRYLEFLDKNGAGISDPRVFDQMDHKQISDFEAVSLDHSKGQGSPNLPPSGNYKPYKDRVRIDAPNSAIDQIKKYIASKQKGTPPIASLPGSPYN